jgi:hypothetical protein
MATNEVFDPDNLPRDAEGKIVVSQEDREYASENLGVPLAELDDEVVRHVLLFNL